MTSLGVENRWPVRTTNLPRRGGRHLINPSLVLPATSRLTLSECHSGQTSDLALKKATRDLNRAKRATAQLQRKLDLLTRYSIDKENRKLGQEVEKARSNELAKQAAWELQKAKEARLEKSITNCKLVAPADGEVVLGPGIEQGVHLGERQLIFQISTGDRVEPSR
jgi:hypothetical protein